MNQNAVQVLALEKWLSFPARKHAHPVLAFAHDALLVPRGIRCADIHYDATALLEGLSAAPYFDRPNFDLSACSVPTGHPLETIARSDPALVFALSSTMDVSCAVPRNPTLMQVEAIRCLETGGIESVQEWIRDAARNFTSFVNEALLAVTVPNPDQNDLALFLSAEPEYCRQILDRGTSHQTL